MASLKHLYLFILPVIIVSSIPLAFFATLTSILALAILLFRVLVVYAELAIAVIPYYVLGLGLSTQGVGASLEPHLTRNKSSSFTTLPTGTRRRNRRSSSSHTITPVASEAQLHIPLSSSVGLGRDFEGVGGWRLDTADDDVLWTSMNSRLELPADHVKRHRRSATGGSGNVRFERGASFGIGVEGELGTGFTLGNVPVESNVGRVRTPLESTVRDREREEYFGTGGSPKISKRAHSVVTNISISPVSSKGSGLSMKQRA